MYNQSIIVEKQCIGCKLGAGTLFSAYGFYHALRFQQLWRHYRFSEKVFNVFATMFIFSLSFVNFYYAHEIYMGKEMKLVELRPSYTQRFRELY